MTGAADPIDAALARGDVAGAVALARAALAAGDQDPFVRNLVAWQLANHGDAVGAEQLVRAGLGAPPHDPGLLSTLGLALRRQMRFSEALQAFDAAIAVAPDYAVAWLERGFALHQGNSLRLADASYRRAAALDPGKAAAFAGIAAIAAAQGEAAIARDFAFHALTIDATDAVAHCALARIDIATGDAAAAATRLRQLLVASGLSADNRSTAESLLGDALARLDQPGAAVAAYRAAKADMATRFSQLLGAEPLHHVAQRLTAQFAVETRQWPPTPPENPRGHAFLLGFPRSGTTLVETVLASVAGVETLEELPTLAAAEAAFLRTASGLAALATAEPETLAALRAAYWQRVAEFGVSNAARLFIDMDPMKTLHLPLIGRLFGTAPIIVMRRDPRDVVLSCFRQNFAASPMALEFTTLERSAGFYAAMMQLQVASLARLPNPVHILHYEAVVADFDGATQRLCDFLGLPWSEALRDFSNTARRRDVSTASVGQVRRGLYDGAGQWRRFAAEMAPVLPILQPWVKAFGYR